MATVKKAAKTAKKTPTTVKAPAKKVASKPAPSAVKKAASAKAAAPKKVAAPKAAPKKAAPAKAAPKKAAAKPASASKPAPKKAAIPAKVAKSAPKVAAAKPAPAKPVVAKKAEVKKVPAKPAASVPKQAEPAKPVVPAKPIVKKSTPAPEPVKPAAPVAKQPASAVTAPKEEPKPVVKPVAVVKPAPKPAPKPIDIKSIKTSVSTIVRYEPDFTKSVLDDPGQETPNLPTMRYSDVELVEFKDLIMRKLDAAKKELAYLQGLITRKDEMGGDESENRYMTMEDGSISMEREQLSQMASRQIQFTDHLEKALMRIENKTYGICRVTGKLIDKARLRAVPHATLSIEAKMGMVKKPENQNIQ